MWTIRTSLLHAGYSKCKKVTVHRAIFITGDRYSLFTEAHWCNPGLLLKPCAICPPAAVLTSLHLIHSSLTWVLASLELPWVPFTQGCNRKKKRFHSAFSYKTFCYTTLLQPLAPAALALFSRQHFIARQNVACGLLHRRQERKLYTLLLAAIPLWTHVLSKQMELGNVCACGGGKKFENCRYQMKQEVEINSLKLFLHSHIVKSTGCKRYSVESNMSNSANDVRKSNTFLKLEFYMVLYVHLVSLWFILNQHIFTVCLHIVQFVLRHFILMR